MIPFLLQAHKLIHTGNKPVFQCELCPTTCGRKTDLKIHVQKLHTSDKPLQVRKHLVNFIIQKLQWSQSRVILGEEDWVLCPKFSFDLPETPLVSKPLHGIPVGKV